MYTCKPCSKRFTRKFNLQRHDKNIHLSASNSIGDTFGRNYRNYARNGNENSTTFEITEKSEQCYDNMLKWKHPFTCIIGGPTSSGKSTFTMRFLKYIDKMVDTPICEVIYCAPESSYPDISDCKVRIKLQDFLPSSEMFLDKKPRLLIIDDMMREFNGSVVDLFTKQSHHLGMSVIFITQNIFHKGKGMRDISLNSHYIVAYKSPRDRSQFSYLARQICPENTPYLNEAFEDATSVSYGYLVMDLTQTTPDHLRYRTNIFPDDNPSNVVYVPKSYHIQN